MGSHTKKLVSQETTTQDKVDGRQLQQRKNLCHLSLCQQLRHSHHQFEELHKMRAFLVFALAASATAQLKFGSDPTEAPKKDVNTRLGLLGTSLGLSPTAELNNNQGSSNGGQSQAFTQGSSGQTPTGRVPNANTNSQINTCPIGQKACCYDPSVDHSSFGRSCIAPGSSAQQFESVRYGCNERVVNSGKQCGTRSFPAPARGLQHGEASPGEFPWTCLVLNQNNDFIGSCAVIPNDSSNNNGRSTRKVVTAAHKLKNVQQNELLKIRVGEYDASGFNSPETAQHEEYTVVRLLKHPQFNAGRLSNDIAILYTDRDINLNKPNVNTACLPSCWDQFGHQFNNGTGVRCWVAGWGKNEVDGSFQFIQHKVDLPLVENNSCNNKLKSALNAQRAGSGNRFSLSQSEICAGGQVGKDACTGDGGSPLVC